MNELDYSGDPGLECIEKQAVWLKSMLLDCQVEHQSLGKAILSRFQLFRFVKVIKTLLSFAVENVAGRYFVNGGFLISYSLTSVFLISRLKRNELVI